MKRFSSSAVCALVLYLGVTTLSAQWLRVADENGRWVCERTDTGHRFVPSYESASFVTVSCNVLTQFEAQALSVKVALNYDSTVDSTYRDGDKPIEDPGEPTTWTLGEKGDAANCQLSETSSTAISLVADGTREGTSTLPANYCYAYQTITGDGQATVQIPSDWVGPDDWAGIGVVVTVGNEDSDWQALCYQFSNASANRLKYGEPETLITTVNGQTGTFLHRAIAIEDAIDRGTCFESADGTNWTPIGEFVADAASYRIGAVMWSHETNVTTSADLTVSFSETITLPVAAAPVEGEPEWDTEISNQSWPEDTAITPIDVSGNCSISSGSKSFSGSGLPTGVSISSAGVISGTPTTSGNGTATIMCSDGTDATDEAFSWQVTQETPGETCATISTGTGAFDGSSCEPGEVIIISGTSRGPLRIQNVFGTAGSPITIRPDTTLSNRLTVTGSSTWNFELRNVEHAVVDGTGGWVGAPAGTCGVTIVNGAPVLNTAACGLQVLCSGGTPQANFKFTRSTKNVTVKGVLIDGNSSWVGGPCNGGQGFDLNDHNYKLEDHPGEWREGFLITQNALIDIHSQGFYWGPNWGNPPVGDLPARNNEISYNYIFRAGGECMEIKSVIAGNTPVHHNYVDTCGGRFTGDTSGGGGGHGIRFFEGGFGEVHSNWVRGTNLSPCLSQVMLHLPASEVATVPMSFYNNVTWDCGTFGINTTHGSGDARVQPTIYNNTFIDTGTAIQVVSIAATPCVVRDNLVAGGSINGGPCTETNNRTGSVASLNFEDSDDDDYRLTDSSPAKNAGTANCPSVDILGVSRPQGSDCDQGAYEDP